MSIKIPKYEKFDSFISIFLPDKDIYSLANIDPLAISHILQNKLHRSFEVRCGTLIYDPTNFIPVFPLRIIDHKSNSIYRVDLPINLTEDFRAQLPERMYEREITEIVIQAIMNKIYQS